MQWFRREDREEIDASSTVIQEAYDKGQLPIIIFLGMTSRRENTSLSRKEEVNLGWDFIIIMIEKVGFGRWALELP